MLKFLLGLLTGLLLVFLSGVLLLFLLFQLRERPPEIASNSVLVVRLAGDIPEKPAVEVPFFENPRAAITVASVWMALRRAAQDSRIQAVVLEPEGLSVGWGKLEEIRSDVEQFRKSGKPVFAYLRTPSAREYYLALAADRIYLGPEDPLMLKGMRAEVLYFQKTLAKLGVTVDVEHDGKYKDFGDMFTRNDMSPETKEVLDSMVDSLYGNLVDRIATSRRMQPDQVRALIDQGPFTAPDALLAGLVDELRFEDQMWGELRQRLGGPEPNKAPLSRYLKASPRTVPRDHFALVVAEGDIVRGDPSDDGGEGLTSYGFDKLLREAAADPLAKGILVRIDSPGGEVTASDEMWREMNLTDQKKPVVISMSDVAASGGYYMAMTGDPIVAYPETETGSIGVVFGKPDLHGLYDKLGITKDAVERGRNAGIDSDYTSLNAEQRALVQRGIDQSYHEFVAKVAAARHRPYAEIEPVAEGRVWLGSQARPRGLVDELGGLDTAIALLKKKAGIPATEDVGLLLYPGRRTLLDIWLKRSQDDALETRLRAVFGRVPFRAWMKGGMLRMMPQWIEVR
ncbi:MAG: signal peptide peptidase SppA [Bryobacteraceae bacterium]